MKLSIDDLVFLKSELNNTRIMNKEDLAYIKASHSQLYFATQLKKDEGVSLFPNNSWVYTLENKKLTSTFCKSSFSDSSNFSSEMIAGVTKYAIGRVGFNGGSFCHSLSPPIAKILYLF